MKMFLNNTETSIAVNNFFRGLEIDGEENSFFRFELNFNNDYSSQDIDYLATFAGKNITDIKIINKNNEVVLELHNIQAKLQNLYENYNDENKSANATISITYSNGNEE